MDNTGTFDANDGTWLSKAEAATLLRVKPRQVERRAEQGYLQKVTLKKLPWERRGRVVFSRGDIEALLRGKPNHHAVLVPESQQSSDGAAPALEKVGKSQSAAEFEGNWRDLALHVLASAKPADVKPWLSLSEAAEYSGLPLRWLLQRAKAGEIHAVNVGLKRERWMFNRDALAKFPS